MEKNDTALFEKFSKGRQCGVRGEVFLKKTKYFYGVAIQKISEKFYAHFYMIDEAMMAEESYLIEETVCSTQLNKCMEWIVDEVKKYKCMDDVDFHLFSPLKGQKIFYPLEDDAINIDG